MCAVSICYAITAISLSSFYQYIPKRGIIQLGLCFQSLGVMISGFDEIHNWGNPAFYTIVGLIFFGIGMAMMTIPLVPEILEAIEESYSYNGEQINNYN